MSNKNNTIKDTVYVRIVSLSHRLRLNVIKKTLGIPKDTECIAHLLFTHLNLLREIECLKRENDKLISSIERLEY